MTPTFETITRHTAEFGEIDLNVAFVGDTDAPLILCVHGWPEIWHSWRHQMEHFSALGYRVAAMDVRGYGASSRPEEISAYRLSELAGDAAAVLTKLSPNAPAVLFGHDWGAPIVWNTARLHPERVRAVAGMSVPYRPATKGDPMDLWDALYPDSYFYMRYFQTVGAAEAEFAADMTAAMRKTYYCISADGPREAWMNKTVDSTFLDGLVEPDPTPEWMSNAALAPTIEAHRSGSMHGAFHRYRAQYLDGDDIEGAGEPVLTQPTCFIAGESDMVRFFVPGVDAFADAGKFLADFRGTTLISRAGHWVQQEKPEETNKALAAFLESL